MSRNHLPGRFWAWGAIGLMVLVTALVAFYPLGRAGPLSGGTGKIYQFEKMRQEGAGRVFARDIHGNETVVYDGTAWIRSAQVESGFFMVVTTQTRWGMLGHEGYIRSLRRSAAIRPPEACTG